MSDVAGSQRSMRTALEPSTGCPGCPCTSEPSARSSPAASSSRSRSASGGGGGSADSSAGTEIQHYSGSEASKDAVPEGYPVQEWSGLSHIRLEKCEHGRRVILKKCRGGSNHGRRFLGCPLEGNQRCKYVQWLDEEWSDRVKAGFKSLWSQYKITLSCQHAGTDALIDAWKAIEKKDKEKAELQEVADRHKRFAEQMINCFKRRTRKAKDEKFKLLVVVYCLLGIIMFLLAFIWKK